MVDSAPAAEAALRSEEYFVRALGGFVLGIAGADLVTHERLPLPRFNFVHVREVAPERRTAFFERALDHYFQRALRPTFRVPEPVAAHLDSGLRSLGFQPRTDRLALLEPNRVEPVGTLPFEVRTTRETEFDEILSLWTGEKDRPELRSAVDVVWHHPNPGERLTPVVARRAGRLSSGGLLYEYLGSAGLHFIATEPGERGQGSASALVAAVFGPGGIAESARGFLFADSPRLERRLTTLGFRVVRTFVVYELPASADLTLPPAPRAGPPRWRPPRTTSASS